MYVYPIPICPSLIPDIFPDIQDLLHLPARLSGRELTFGKTEKMGEMVGRNMNRIIFKHK